MKLLPYRRSAALYLAALALSTLWVSFEAGPLPYMLFYAVLLLPVLSALYLFIVNLTVRFHQEVSLAHLTEGEQAVISTMSRRHRLTKGEQSQYTLIVENVGFLPFVRLTLCMETDRAHLPGIEPEQDISLKPGERWTSASQIVCRYAGTYVVGLLSYRMEDCFHLCRVELPVPAPFRAVVLPALPEDGDRPPELEALRSVLEVRTPYLSDASLGNDLREYRRGDSVRRIHWKNSARAQKLLTRLPEPKEMQRMQVVMIPAPLTDALPDVIRRDRFLELAVSVAYYFCREKKPVEFFVPKGTVQRRTVDAFETFREFYENLPDEVKAIDGMDDGAWDAWMRENCAPEGTVLVLREGPDETASLSVFDPFGGEEGAA